MSISLPRIYLVRHGETEWSRTGQHTGMTDLALTAHGVQQARGAGLQLRAIKTDTVFTSPLKRALQTCELAGFGKEAKKDNDLVEWDYGDYEGKTTAEIQLQRPDWELFRDGCPGGESLQDVTNRAKRVVKRLRTGQGDAIIFSHGHFLRVFTACWLGFDAGCGRSFYLDTAALCILGYGHGLHEPVIRLWNDTSTHSA